MRVLFGCLLLFGCSQAADTLPPGILPRDKFQAVLLESQLIEARVQHEVVIDREASVPVSSYYARMFEEMNVTKKEFDDSFDHYSRRPEEMRGIYEDILTELTRRKDHLEE